MNKADISKWYDENELLHKDFCIKIETLIREIISSEEIPTHSIAGRVKDEESLLEKFEKRYKDINEITDIVGIRVITFVLEDVDKICELLEKEFEVDEVNSGDKATELKDNEMGYLSKHYILKLSSSRCKLSEYKRFNRLVFEIQVRTLLQHAWASMSHENQYKFSGKLPSEIDRRFYLTAGTLELLDIEFQRLSDELKEYKKDIAVEIEDGNLDIEINSTTLAEYLDKRFNCFKEWSNFKRTFRGQEEKVIYELGCFGVNSLADLDELISDEVAKILVSHSITYNGLLRDMMVFVDADKYFGHCWDNTLIMREIATEGLSKYVKNLKDILRKYNIRVSSPKSSSRS